MGRSFYFDFCRDVLFPSKLSSSDDLSRLTVGQIVELDIRPNTAPRPVCRCVSTYGATPSSHHSSQLIVENCDYYKDFNEHGIRCIVFRDVTIPKEEHIYAWCVTTDGYVREIEHFGISGEVVNVWGVWEPTFTVSE